MNKENKYVLVIFIITIFFLGTLWYYRYWETLYIDKNPAYVLGYVHHIDNDNEGVIFKFIYKYNGKIYGSSVKDIRLRMQHGFIILKIAKNKPSLWNIIDQDIPKCLVEKASLNKYWNSIPFCDI